MPDPRELAAGDDDDSTSHIVIPADADVAPGDQPYPYDDGVQDDGTGE